MKPQAILKKMIWQYQKSRLGAVGEGASINVLADVRGDRKNIFIGKSATICKFAALEVDEGDGLDSKIAIGDNTVISSFVMVRTHGGVIKIGDNCFVNSFSMLHGNGGLTIGNNCLLGPQVTIVPGSYGFRDRDVPIKYQPRSAQGINIEDDVWIGTGVTILDGCTIGKGCIIGAGSVVNKSLEPYSIVSGGSAKLIGVRE